MEAHPHPQHPPPLGPHRGQRGAQGEARLRGDRPTRRDKGRDPRRRPSRRRRRRSVGGKHRGQGAGYPGPHRGAHSLPLPHRTQGVRRGYVVRDGMRPALRGHRVPDVDVRTEDYLDAARDLGVLRARVHTVQRQVRGVRRPAQRRPSGEGEGGGGEAGGGGADGAHHGCERVGDEPFLPTSRRLTPEDAGDGERRGRGGVRGDEEAKG